jgi:DNA-binding transcriptional ArsR family regulator
VLWDESDWPSVRLRGFRQVSLREAPQELLLQRVNLCQSAQLTDSRGLSRTGRNVPPVRSRLSSLASAAAEASSVAISRPQAHSAAMSVAPQIAEVAALVGDPTRANILCALLGGRAITAAELAFAAHVSPQTASEHLAKLLSARLVVVMKQGRHRYYQLAGPHVGQMLESIMNVALVGPPRFQPRSKVDDLMRRARTCYDHLAGMLGVGIADGLIERAFVVLGDDAGEVTAAGASFLTELGVDLSAARTKRRIFCRPCLDWTERRPHIGGAVGAAIAGRCFELKWIERVGGSRAVTVTPPGRRELMSVLGLSM